MVAHSFNSTPHLIHPEKRILDALEQLEHIPDRTLLTLFVIDPHTGVLSGTITDGDIRRGLLKGINVNDSCHLVQNPSFRHLILNEFDINQIKEFQRLKIRLLPVLDAKRRLLELIDLSRLKSILPVDVVLMAGGRGQRLMPLTATTPKPMIEVAGKPILEWNLLRLKLFGIRRVFISVKYLSHVIKEYFGTGEKLGIEINYIEESEPLGTAGCMTMVKDWAFNDVLLMNSDLLTTVDFEAFYMAFKQADSAVSLVSIPYQVLVPYAILETDGYEIQSLKEKPTFTYHANGGIYFLKRSLIEKFQNTAYLDATDILDYSIQHGMSVTHFPNLNYWLDIGQHPDLEKARSDFHNIQYL